MRLEDYVEGVGPQRTYTLEFVAMGGCWAVRLPEDVLIRKLAVVPWGVTALPDLVSVTVDMNRLVRASWEELEALTVLHGGVQPSGAVIIDFGGGAYSGGRFARCSPGYVEIEGGEGCLRIGVQDQRMILPPPRRPRLVEVVQPNEIHHCIYCGTGYPLSKALALVSCYKCGGPLWEKGA